MGEYIKLLLDGLSKDAKGTLLAVALFAIYVLFKNIGDNNTEFITMKNEQLKELNQRLDHCEAHRASDALRIDEMYSILKKQDSIIIELNTIIKYR